MGIPGQAPRGAPICFKNYIIRLAKLVPVTNPTLEFKILKTHSLVVIGIRCSRFQATVSETPYKIRSHRFRKAIPQQERFNHCYCFWKRVYFTYMRSLVQQGSNPSNFARPTFLTRKQDILSSVCVLPINVNGFSFQRNVQEMDRTI